MEVIVDVEVTVSGLAAEGGSVLAAGAPGA